MLFIIIINNIISIVLSKNSFIFTENLKNKNYGG